VSHQKAMLMKLRLGYLLFCSDTRVTRHQFYCCISQLLFIEYAQCAAHRNTETRGESWSSMETTAVCQIPFSRFR